MGESIFKTALTTLIETNISDVIRANEDCSALLFSKENVFGTLTRHRV